MPALLKAGDAMPQITLPTTCGSEVTVGKNVAEGRYTLFSFYRALFCPLCKKFNSELEGKLADLDALGFDVVFVSMDPKEDAEKAKEQWGLKSKCAPLLLLLSYLPCVTLGWCCSWRGLRLPRHSGSPPEAEADYPFGGLLGLLPICYLCEGVALYRGCMFGVAPLLTLFASFLHGTHAALRGALLWGDPCLLYTSPSPRD